MFYLVVEKDYFVFLFYFIFCYLFGSGEVVFDYFEDYIVGWGGENCYYYFFNVWCVVKFIEGMFYVL